MSARSCEKSPLKRAASFAYKAVSAFTGGPFEGLEDDSESESDTDEEDEEDEDVLPMASICSHSGGEGRKRSCLSDEADDMDDDPNDIFEQARASAAEAQCSLASPRQAEQSDESDDDRGLDGTGDEDGEVDEVYDLCHACEDPNDVFAQARASAVETKANCSPVRATSAEAECSTASPQPDESDDERGLDGSDHVEGQAGGNGAEEDEDEDDGFLERFAGSPSPPTRGNHNKSDLEYWSACCTLSAVQAALSLGVMAANVAARAASLRAMFSSSALLIQNC